MSGLIRYRVLVCGIVSWFAAPRLYTLVYTFLTGRSADLQEDWLLRLSLATLAMIAPFLVTLFLAISDHRRRALSVPAGIGLVIAALSLGYASKPIGDGVTRWKQERNLARRDVAAPLFETPDIHGTMQRLANHKGDVVIVNIWATWCPPCRTEMPELDRLYRDRKDQGLMVFGLSDEPAVVQDAFLRVVPVSYPLLTLDGNVPAIYRDIARYPAIFLIDRQGRLQPAPGPDEPFASLEAAVDTLLAQPGR